MVASMLMSVRDEPVVLSIAEMASFWAPAAVVSLVVVSYIEWRGSNGQG